MKTYDGPKVPILIDQGTGDNFLDKYLMPDNFRVACGEANYPLILRMQNGFDHSYYFISTFMKDHITHHAATMGIAPRK